MSAVLFLKSSYVSLIFFSIFLSRVNTPIINICIYFDFINITFVNRLKAADFEIILEKFMEVFPEEDRTVYFTYNENQQPEGKFYRKYLKYKHRQSIKN